MTMENRQRQTVPLLGINRAEPALTVKDGACETLHNLRYDAGAWRNVDDFRKLHDVSDFGGFTLLYKHPATSDDLYIARDGAGTIHEVRLSGGVFVSVQVIRPNVPDLQTLFAFGNVLVLVTPEAEYSYILYGTSYVLFGTPAPPAFVVEQPYRYDMDVSFYFGSVSSGSAVSYTFIDTKDFQAGNPPTPAAAGHRYYTRIADIEAQQVLLPISGPSGSWHGEVALMCAYLMTDGTVIANSELVLIVPEALTQAEAETGPYGYGSDGLEIDPETNGKAPKGLYITSPVHFGNTNNYYTLPKVTVTIPSGIDKRLITDVGVYATRINPLFNYAQLWNDDGEWLASAEGEEGDDRRKPVTFRRLYEKKNDLFNQPLYRILEIPIDDFTDNSYTFSLNYSLLKDAETQPVYEPTQSLHAQTARVYFEYNARLHKAGTRTRLFPGYTGFCTYELSPVQAPGGALYNACLVTTVNIEGRRYDVVRRIAGNVASSVGRVVSYPDYRAERLGILREDARTSPEGGPLAGSWQADTCLKPYEANNYACAVLPLTKNVKYPAFGLSGVEREAVSPSGALEEPNRLQVSATGNLFAMPFANSYRVGNSDETILALATVADELSETRFGAYPLYVFTNRGVWSLESGSGEILYSNIIPVNHDRIINPATATAAGTVFYITSQGLYGLQGRRSRLLSEPLSDMVTDYLAGAEMHYQFKYGDLLVYNPAYSYAYVYAVQHGVWSTRDMAGTVLNNDEIVTASHLSALDDEAPQRPTECLAVTRPVKLGNTEFKRLETLVARVASRDTYAHLHIDGSNDCARWLHLRDEWCNVRDMDMRLRRTPCSCKYFRFTLHLTANEPLAVTGIDTEFYPRFVGKLR